MKVTTSRWSYKIGTEQNSVVKDMTILSHKSNRRKYSGVASRLLGMLLCLGLLLGLAACTPSATPAPTANPTPSAPPPQVTSSPWMRFNRWGIAFEFPRKWYEWEEPQRAMAARDVRASLTADTTSIPRTLQDLTVLTSADQQGGVYVGIYLFQTAVAPEDFLADRRASFESEQAAGNLTIGGIPLTTVADYPAVEVVVQRATGGRSRTLYILLDERCIQLQFVLLDLNLADDYQPIFKYILSTVQLAD
jgi:hypothetical protein